MGSTALKAGLLALVLLVSGCANQSMPGYQRVYQGYAVPQELADAVQKRLRAEGLARATVARDPVGRLRLTGQYRDEDEVDRAFLITQSIVGIQSTSPFYPENVQEKQWSRDAGNALADALRRRKVAQDAGPGRKRALVIGINTFMNRSRMNDIQGEDDARVMGLVLANYGYEVMSVLGERATKANIESAIAQMDQSLGANDTLFIYVSSHGAPPIPTPAGGDERRMSIIAYDTGVADPSNARGVDKTSFALNVHRTSVRDTLIQKLAQKPTAFTRVLIDTCYSGEILKDLASEGAAYQARVNGGTHEKASVSLASWTGASFTAKSIAYVDDAPPRAAAPDARQDAGFATRRNYTFITATGPGEKAYGPDPTKGTFASPVGDGDVLRGSYFTQSFMAYLKRFSGDVPRAFEASRSFTSQYMLENRLPQNPRRFTTMPAEHDNLAKY